MKTNRFLVAFVFVSFLVVAPAAFGDTIAYVSWSYSALPSPNSLIWKVDLDTQEITTVASFSQSQMSSLKIAVSPIDNKLSAMSSGTGTNLWEIDPTMGTISPVWGISPCGVMAFAPDGELYTHTGQRQKLAKYDIAQQTGGSFGIALPTGFPNPFGFAINNEGEAIVVDNYQGFYSVNLSNGAFTTIGSVAGLPSPTIRGLACDYDTDRFIGVSDYGIFNIDIDTMTATQLMSFTPPVGANGTTNYQGRGIAIESSVPEPTTATLLMSGLIVASLRRFRHRK